MNITIVQGAFLPIPTLRGGAVEKMWFELGKQFVSKGHTVTHISRNFPGLPSSEFIEGVKHIRVRGYDWPSNPIILKFLDLLYSLSVFTSLPKADILITNTFWLPLLASFFQHKFGSIIVDVQRIPKGQMYLYSFVSCIRANSSSVSNAIQDQSPLLRAKVVIIPNPLPYDPPSFPLVQKEQVILYCGRLHPEKGIELLLSAFQLAFQRGLTDWTLRLVGSADVPEGGGGRAWIERLITKQIEAGLPVEWLGAIYDEPKLQLEYQRAPIFVYPSLADQGESFGMAPLEAMAFGAVPIVSSVSCFQDFIKSGINGLVFDHHRSNANSLLASEILNLTSNPTYCRQLSNIALDVRHSHHPSKIADKFLYLFAELCSHN